MRSMIWLANVCHSSIEDIAITKRRLSNLCVGGPLSRVRRSRPEINGATISVLVAEERQKARPSSSDMMS